MKKKRKKLKRRNPYALPAQMRKAACFKDKKKEESKRKCRRNNSDRSEQEKL